MQGRRIENLDDVEGTGNEAGTDGATAKAPASAPTPSPRKAEAAAALELVEFHYPEPTPLSVILKDVSRWSRFAIVLEPSANARLQVFAPRRLPQREAWDLFLAALSVVGLRAVQVGQVVKIVPSSIIVAA
jgi:hypothetical protein